MTIFAKHKNNINKKNAETKFNKLKKYWTNYSINPL